MADANFHIKTSSYLGINYSNYRDFLYGQALSDPQSYFSYRRDANEYIKTEATRNLYDVIFYALTSGKKMEGGVLTANDLSADMPPGGPNLPEQLVNQLALSAARTLDKIMTEIMEYIAPLDYRSIANKRLETIGEAKGIA